MNSQIILVLILNFIISLIGTLAYSVRLVGVRTGKIAVSFALFNVLMLVSRTAVTFQTPLLTSYVEVNPSSNDLLYIFNIIIVISSIATVAGAFLIPTFQRLLCRAVESFSQERSLSKILIHSFSKSGVRYMKDCISIPSKKNLTKLKISDLPLNIIVLNTITVALITVGVLSPIYAGGIAPELRATCITLSSAINGFATIFMSIFIDPQLSIMTDDVIDGKCSESAFRACVIAMVGSKTIGTVLSLLLLLPASYLIVGIAQFISYFGV
jgi:hypothetical protein